jgi:hypothetical protein
MVNASAVAKLWIVALGLMFLAPASVAAPVSLPGQYFRLIEVGAEQVEAKLNAEPSATIETLAAHNNWRHFPYAILAPAVLYAKQHPTNRRYHDPKMLALAIRIGDMLAVECEKGRNDDLLDGEWDTYMWGEAYRLLKTQLGEDRRARWRREIEKIVAVLVSDTEARLNFPWYATPYIRTSPNHFSSHAALLLLGGRVFENKAWESLGSRVLHRFAAEEQTVDGYWGEHNRLGPTTGYNYITMTQVAFYWEYTHDPAALEALRRVTDFHKYFTYPDGAPVETINDRNRHWNVDSWGHFGFSNFADGRRYAEFLTGFFKPDGLGLDNLGRLAQDALYYHEGPKAPIPQDLPRYSHEMAVPAGIRKVGPWVVCLSGIFNTQAVDNQFYLDRQAHISVFHEKTGMIISGANSKRQPELATFLEKFDGQTFHMPISTRLKMNDKEDHLSLAYNKFFSDVFISEPSANEVRMRFVLTGKGDPPDEAQLNLQLVLKGGEVLETAGGKKITLGAEHVELSPEDLGGSIRHHGWTLKVDPTARLTWPIFPFNPYQNGPETTLDYAVARLSVPLRTKPGMEHRGFRPSEQEILFDLEVK